MTELRIGSLCSGYGGLDMAVEAAFGARTVWHVEYDKAPSSILAHNYPDIPNYGDLTTTDWNTVEPIDILTGGYPCQPFSHAGKREGTNDERHIWPWIGSPERESAIRVLRPRWCVFENVGGHLSLGLGDVLADLAALGYDVRWGSLRAADIGAPHGRLRVFILAVRKDAADTHRLGQ